MGKSIIIYMYALVVNVDCTTASISFNKWVLDHDFENNLDTSKLLWVKDGISLLTCSSLSNLDPSCWSFFYHPLLTRCMGSQSYKRGLPTGQSMQEGWKYFTKAPKCDGDYTLYRPLGLCYKIHTDKRTFIEAMDACEVEGAKLIIIRNEPQFVHVQNAVIDAIGSPIGPFIGFRKIVSNATIIWKWWNGQEASYLNWAPGEPNNKGGIERCVEFCSHVDCQFKFNDVECQIQRPFICQKNI